MFFKLTVEVGQIVEATFISELPYLFFGGNQHFAGITNPDLIDIGDQTDAGDALEKGHEIAVAQRNELGQNFHGKILGKMLIDVSQYRLQPCFVGGTGVFAVVDVSVGMQIVE